MGWVSFISISEGFLLVLVCWLWLVVMVSVSLSSNGEEEMWKVVGGIKFA